MIRKLPWASSICKLFTFGLLALLPGTRADAHPGSGIVVDKYGVVYFTYTGRGVMRLEMDGTLTLLQADNGGHWLALDQNGALSRTPFREQVRVPLQSGNANLIFASGGAPLAVGPDGNLFYGSNGETANSYPTGALTVGKMSPRGEATLFAPKLKAKLEELRDGITALAAASDGSIYIGTWRGVIKLDRNGEIARIWHPLRSDDCDHDPPDHRQENYDVPLFRGLAVDGAGNVFAAATSCHEVLKITPDGKVSTFLKIERPWSVTGVAEHDGNIYLLEWSNANGPATEGWAPRIRKVDASGKVTTLVSVTPPPATSPSIKP